MSKRKTHEEFEREIENIYPNIKPITKYKNLLHEIIKTKNTNLVHIVVEEN